jgi:hypothetical protein
MLIKDLRFIEKTDNTDHIFGGVSAFTEVRVSANGGNAEADAYAVGFGNSTNAATTAYTRSAKGSNYELSAAVGSGVAYAFTLNGRKPIVTTSVSTGVATDVKLT